MNKVIIEKNGPVKTVWMNRPEKRNALDSELLGNMIEALQAPVAADDRVVVIRGKGDVFCAGLDMAERSKTAGAGKASGIEVMLRAIELCPLPGGGRGAGRRDRRRQRAGAALRPRGGEPEGALRHVAGPGRPGAQLVPGQEADGSAGTGDDARDAAAGRSPALDQAACAGPDRPLRAGRPSSRPRPRR